MLTSKNVLAKSGASSCMLDEFTGTEFCTARHLGPSCSCSTKGWLLFKLLAVEVVWWCRVLWSHFAAAVALHSWFGTPPFLSLGGTCVFRICIFGLQLLFQAFLGRGDYRQPCQALTFGSHINAFAFRERTAEGRRRLNFSFRNHFRTCSVV